MRISASAIVVFLLLGPAAQAALVTDGLEIRWHADEAGANPASAWQPGAGTAAANTGQNLSVQSGAQYIAADPSSLPGINASYQFDGNNDRLTGASLDSLPSDPGGGATDFSRNSASFEIWFRPSDLIGQEILFETGGSAPYGTGFFLDDGELLFRGASDGNDSPSTENFSVSLDLSSLVMGQFYQAVGIIDMVSQVATLIVNGGALSGQDSFAGTGFDRWAGANATGVAGANSAVGGEFNGELAGFGNYQGEVAIIGFYSDALTEEEVLQNFNHVQGVPAPGPLLLLGFGLMLIRLRMRTTFCH